MERRTEASDPLRNRPGAVRFVRVTDPCVTQQRYQCEYGVRSVVPALASAVLQPWIDWLAFQCEYPEHTFVNAPEWFAGDESFQAFHP